jgi:uncharacterized protein (TIGR02246 family)
VTGLEARVARLEAIEQIRLLKLRYAELCDRSYDADRLADLFTEDAVWDAGDRGHAEGRAAIRELWAGMGAGIPFGVHFITNHAVQVHDDDRATGMAYLWQPLTMDGEACWSATVYEEEYRREDAWRFATMHLHVAFVTPYDTPWPGDVPLLGPPES